MAAHGWIAQGPRYHEPAMIRMAGHARQRLEMLPDLECTV